MAEDGSVLLFPPDAARDQADLGIDLAEGRGADLGPVRACQGARPALSMARRSLVRSGSPAMTAQLWVLMKIRPASFSFDPILRPSSPKARMYQAPSHACASSESIRRSRSVRASARRPPALRCGPEARAAGRAWPRRTSRPRRSRRRRGRRCSRACRSSRRGRISAGRGRRGWRRRSRRRRADDRGSSPLRRRGRARRRRRSPMSPVSLRYSVTARMNQSGSSQCSVNSPCPSP